MRKELCYPRKCLWPLLCTHYLKKQRHCESCFLFYFAPLSCLHSRKTGKSHWLNLEQQSRNSALKRERNPPIRSKDNIEVWFDVFFLRLAYRCCEGDRLWKKRKITAEENNENKEFSARIGAMNVELVMPNKVFEIKREKNWVWWTVDDKTMNSQRGVSHYVANTTFWRK